MSRSFTKPRVALAILVLPCVCSLAATGVHRGFWSDHARPLPILTNETITALALANGNLYVAAGDRLYIAKPDGADLTNVTSNLHKQTADQVTTILVDGARKNLWIATNDNLHVAECYSFAVEAEHCERTFLEDELKMYERLSHNAPQQSSITAMAHDDRGAVVGFFKDGVYLYSLSDEKYKLAHEPKSIYNWSVAALLTPKLGFAATRGNGLIVIDRVTGAASRFPDRNGQYIRALAADGAGHLYIGAVGLYKAVLTDFVPNHTIQNHKVGR